MFGDRVKKERILRQMTQKELSELLGVSPSTVGMYEQNRRQPDSDTIIKLSEIFNVSTDYLLGRTDIKNPSDEISNAVEDDPELIEFWNELKEREDLQLLFKQTKNLSPKDIKQIIRIIKAIEDEEDMLDQ
ncbi:helix-turn-helix transcriptional regulator [Anaerosalibacter bizertensis]|uniref:Helix-turn-helix transcriptional regulator n=1 Tax=Anaerosalibacter bizertensis TaxID=932217 RepID=A0A844FI92_9FIRM|nr:helix-turn-helix transcriptional regulator [Anaerosalibacter bizertensis]MSS43662.1 helix-turn-helix transcriptional regulator [Anaerosalibacter bizertensis]